MATTDIYLPLSVQQLVDLVMQLPQKQKQQLINLLLEKDIAISELQKQLVRDRINKYQAHPDDLVPESEAWDKIDAGAKGKKIAVILPIKDYQKIMEELDELEDIRLYDEAMNDKQKSIPLNQALEKIEARSRKCTKN